MKSFIKHNFLVLALYVIILIVVGYVLLQSGKVQIHLAINSIVGTHLLDTFFKYFTHVGDGIFAILLIIIMLFYNVRKSLYVLFSYAGASLLTTLLKTYPYHGESRPYFIFQFYVRDQLKMVDGVELFIKNSFPSGHSTTAFSVFICLVLMSKNQLLKFLFFLIAVLAAFSRTYISQHWLIDIYVGSIIGVSFSILFYTVFYNKHYLQKLDIPVSELLSKNNTTGV